MPGQRERGPSQLAFQCGRDKTPAEGLVRPELDPNTKVQVIVLVGGPSTCHSSLNKD